METYFSVGEISKLTNVPIETLRYNVVNNILI